MARAKLGWGKRPKHTHTDMRLRAEPSTLETTSGLALDDSEKLIQVQKYSKIRQLQLPVDRIKPSTCKYCVDKTFPPPLAQLSLDHVLFQVQSSLWCSLGCEPLAMNVRLCNYFFIQGSSNKEVKMFICCMEPRGLRSALLLHCHHFIFLTGFTSSISSMIYNHDSFSGNMSFPEKQFIFI